MSERPKLWTARKDRVLEIFLFRINIRNVHSKRCNRENNKLNNETTSIFISIMIIPKILQFCRFWTSTFFSLVSYAFSVFNNCLYPTNIFPNAFSYHLGFPLSATMREAFSKNWAITFKLLKKPTVVFVSTSVWLLYKKFLLHWKVYFASFILISITKRQIIFSVFWDMK